MVKAYKKVAWLILFGSVIQGQPPALENLGNSCYVNALLQNLFNLPKFNHAVLGASASGKFDKNYFVLAYKDLVQEQFGNKAQRTVTVGDFSKGLIRFYSFVGDCFKCGYKEGTQCSQKLLFQQQDASELFTKFTSLIFDKLSLVESEKIMQIRIAHTLDCYPESQYRNVTTERTTSLLLSVQSGFLEDYSTLSESLNAYFSVNKVDDYKPEGELNAVPCTQYLVCKNTPEYVVFGLNRFSLEGKLTHPISINSTLTFVEPASGNYYIAVDAVKNVAAVYDLIGVVLHKGFLDTGHYRAYVKDQYDPLHQWYECNDAVITNIGKKLSADAQRDIDENAYMLFYKKITPEYERYLDELAHECAVLAQLYSA